MSDTTPQSTEDIMLEIAPFDPTRMKKKKKKAIVNYHVDNSLHSLGERREELSECTGDSFHALKRNSPLENSRLSGHTIDNTEDLDASDGRETGLAQQSWYSWEGSQCDYKYEELLRRIFGVLRENNPELAGDKRRIALMPPQILWEGITKTVFVNLMDLSKALHRKPEHLMIFMLTELGTSGSMDGENRLVITGRFPPKNIEGVLQRYISEYVLCHCCRSPDTMLSKEKGNSFLQCDMCGSGRSVVPIEALLRRKTRV